MQAKLLKEIAKSSELETKVLNYEKSNNQMKIKIDSLLINLTTVQKSNDDSKMQIKTLESELEILNKYKENAKECSHHIKELEMQNVSLKNKLKDSSGIENKLKEKNEKNIFFEKELEVK